MDKKYTVFVSSTYEDLKEERAEVMRALLECDCIPCGMELFPSANDDSWTFIKSVIEECDYYLLLVAGRYGSISTEGKSFTEMEFRYAMEIGKPIISFPHANPEQIPAGKSCQSDTERRGLEQFMTLVNQKQRRAWKSSEELGALVHQSIAQLKKSHPAIGWIRGDKPASEEILIENRNLRKENDELQRKISALEAERGLDLVQGDDPITIAYAVKYSYANGEDIEERQCLWHTTWDEVFLNSFPNYQTRLGATHIHLNVKKAIEILCKGDIDACFAEMADLKGNIDQFSKEESIKRFGFVSLSDDMENMILFQFTSLGYIKEEFMNNRNRTEIHWILTDKGRRRIIQAHAIHLSRNASQTNFYGEERKD